MMPMLVLGQNTAQAGIPGIPFKGTKSGRKLEDWLQRAYIPHYRLANVSEEKTEGNRPLKVSRIKEIAASQEFAKLLQSYECVLAVGRQAHQAVNFAQAYHELSIKFLAIEHPSGLNRKLNRKGKEDEIIDDIFNFFWRQK